MTRAYCRAPLAATMLAGAAIGVGAAPAAAAKSDCPYEYFCAWQHPNYRGGIAKWKGDSDNWRNTIEDQDSSWYNNGRPGTYDHVMVYSKHNLGGISNICLTPGDSISSSWWAGDSGSSHVWTRWCEMW